MKTINKIKNILKDNKITIIIYSILNIITLIYTIIELLNKDIQNIILCIVTILLLSLPFIIEKKFKLIIPNILKISIFIYIFGTQILGEVNHFYVRVLYWDKYLHALHGFLGAGLSFSLIYLLNRKIAASNLSRFFIILTTFCISTTIGITWEVLEYSADNIFQVDSQNDVYINNISSMLLDPKKESKVIKIKDIEYTIIYDKDDNILTKFNGYLDIGLHDTMIDIIVNSLGSITFCIIGYLYLTNNDDNKNNKYKFIENFLIKRQI